MSAAPRLVLATRNPGKVDEIRALLADLPVDILAADDLDAPLDVDEDASTLRGNAEKKARAYHAATGHPALADDTGLEIDVLGGRPGVHTARFAGLGATPADNRARTLRELDGIEDRGAQFRTVVAYVDADGAVHFFEGSCRGTITREERGEGGFGYDSIFLPDGQTQTFAEMSPEQKNAISHRKEALETFADFLREKLSRSE